ncbi:MAG: hypothetical protein JO047_14935, partial [Alphaproteobacteria bacterium]|nr:hypothetical protein [Alphaproteobacteria bacterium]
APVEPALGGVPLLPLPMLELPPAPMLELPPSVPLVPAPLVDALVLGLWRRT